MPPGAVHAGGVHRGRPCRDGMREAAARYCSANTSVQNAPMAMQ